MQKYKANKEVVYDEEFIKNLPRVLYLPPMLGEQRLSSDQTYGGSKVKYKTRPVEDLAFLLIR